MKKTISLLLALVMCLSLCACGGGNDTPETTEAPTETTTPEVKVMTKEEMLEQAVAVDQIDINNDSFENIVKAKSMYCNAILLLEGTIFEIKEDHIEVGTSDWLVDVYLPVEDMINLRNKQKILVVGQTNDTIEETTWSYGEYSGTNHHYSMPTAYLVQDKFEVTGKIHSASDAYENGFNFKVGDNPYLWVLFFDESFDRSNAKANEDGSITVLGIVCDSHIYDAIIVE